MKRVVVIALLVFSALGASSMRASAAGVPALPHPGHAASASDYDVGAYSCTGTNCAEEEVWNDSSAQVGPPTGGYYECYNYTYLPFGIQWTFAEIDFGEEGFGSVHGTAGLLTPTTMYSDLAGSGVMNFGGAVGPESGTAIGSVRFDPFHDYVLTSGKITITLRGTVWTETYNFFNGSVTYTSRPGTMSCTISPTSDSYYGID